MDDLSQRIIRLENILLELKSPSNITSDIQMFRSTGHRFTLTNTSKYFDVEYQDADQAIMSRLYVYSDEWFVEVLPQAPVGNKQKFLLIVPENATDPFQADVQILSTIPVVSVSLD